MYDLILSTKKAINEKLVKNGARSVEFLPFAFHPIQHYVIEDTGTDSQYIYPDVCIVGGADAERASFVNDFLEEFSGSLGLYGADWSKYTNIASFDRGYVQNEAYCRVLNKSKLNVGLVRRSNQDEHSMRSFEIAACGGVAIYEDTSVHRDLLPGYPEYGFFQSSKDLAQKSNWLLDHPVELEEMRQLGIELIVTPDNTYTARLKYILELTV